MYAALTPLLKKHLINRKRIGLRKRFKDAPEGDIRGTLVILLTKRLQRLLGTRSLYLIIETFKSLLRTKYQEARPDPAVTAERKRWCNCGDESKICSPLVAARSLLKLSLLSIPRTITCWRTPAMSIRGLRDIRQGYWRNEETQRA